MTEPKDHFPETLRTWVGQRVTEGTPGRPALNRHVMEAYADPLRIYFLGSSLRSLGEAEDLVAGFFSDRLDREDFFRDWQQSGKRLRHWLINAFHFYLKEELRRLQRVRRQGALPEDLEIAGSEPPPEVVMDRLFCESLVTRALALARQRCLDAEQAVHWEIFERHHCREEPYRAFAAELGVDEAQAAVLARVARRRFVRALREELARDGVPPERLDSELALLVEGTGG